jgi:hypothetical protein
MRGLLPLAAGQFVSSHVLATAVFGAAILAAVPAGMSIAYLDQADSTTRYGNGHQGVTFAAYTSVDFVNNGASGWNARETWAWMDVTNSLDALCDRSRLFSAGFTQIGNKNWAGSPFPMTSADGWKLDSYTWPQPAASWALRAWWQVDDQFSGGQCDYGGGVGVTRSTSTGSDITETVPSP